MKNNRRIPLELYVHIPFCVRKCQYCDFLSGPSDEETKDRYIEALLKEIRAAEHTEDYEIVYCYYRRWNTFRTESRSDCFYYEDFTGAIFFL